ncbi:MAG: transposase [Nitrospira sp.]|nr:transposase [Nitrospira sp.]
MRKRTSTKAVESSAVCYDTLEQWAREHIQIQLQTLLEEEVTTFLGRVRHERRSRVTPVDPPVGSRNGYGKPRHFSMMNGTVTVRRPRVRDLAERFEGKILGTVQAADDGSRRTFAPELCTCMGCPPGISTWRCAVCSARVRRCRRTRFSD